MNVAGGPFALTPLMDAIGTENLTHLSDRLALSKKVLRRMRRTGLDPWEADRLAVRAGCLPMEVWGELWWDAIPDEEEQLVLASRP